jgi:hypothetical protein
MCKTAVADVGIELGLAATTAAQAGGGGGGDPTHGNPPPGFRAVTVEQTERLRRTALFHQCILGHITEQLMTAQVRRNT